MKTLPTIALALLAGCSEPSPTNQSAETQPPAVARKTAATATKPPPAPGCSASITVSLNRALMARENGATFPDARLADFQHRLQSAFHGAADALCADDAKVARALKPISSVAARSGAGELGNKSHRPGPDRRVLANIRPLSR